MSYFIIYSVCYNSLHNILELKFFVDLAINLIINKLRNYGI